MTKTGRAAIVLILIACFASFSFSLSIPAKPQGYVNDYASLLDPQQRSQLDNRLRNFEKQTTNQVLVAIFPSLEEEDLEDFTNRLFQTWKIGQKNRDNGVLLTVFVKERRVRIEVGYGLEGVLTDALSSRIIRNELAPEFRAGRYGSGIEKAIDAIEKATRGEYKAPEQQTPQYVAYLPMAMFVIFLILILIISNRTRRRSRFWSRRGRFDDWWIIPGGRWGGGGGGFGGGGFSGGGGSSGGGGASGGW